MGLLADIRDEVARLCARRYTTLFGTARVYQTSWGDTRIRVLDIDDTYQSATYLDYRWCEVPFPYLALYDAVFHAAYPAKDLCMLGGGGYAFPKHVIAHYRSACIDVVEIDPVITRIAYEHFLVDKLENVFHASESGRLATYNLDAIEHLRRCAESNVRYDAILNDCFAGNEADSELCAPEALALVHRCLTHHGMYLTNTICALEGPDAAPLIELVELLSAEFSYVYALTCDRCEPDEKDNLVVVASNSDPCIREAIPLARPYET